jgi:sterol desaturase/sphingolipid hydroxylase (fatty acid hydroxylase superfamily)
VTSGFRFHPGEALVSMALKGVVIVVLGPPVAAVLLFEVLLNGFAMFNHGNVRIPERIDRYLRWFVVTPDMHRVHHSVRYRESNTNFGFNLPWWDRLFGTYTPQPEDGHEGMRIGLEEYYENRRQSFWWLLALPFRPRPATPQGQADANCDAQRDDAAPLAEERRPLP